MDKQQQDKHNRNQLRMYLLRYKGQLQKRLDTEDMQPSVVYHIVREIEAIDLLLDNLPIS